MSGAPSNGVPPAPASPPELRAALKKVTAVNQICGTVGRTWPNTPNLSTNVAVGDHGQDTVLTGPGPLA
jgi:hypothetical protein